MTEVERFHKNCHWSIFMSFIILPLITGHIDFQIRPKGKYTMF